MEENSTKISVGEYTHGEKESVDKAEFITENTIMSANYILFRLIKERGRALNTPKLKKLWKE